MNKRTETKALDRYLLPVDAWAMAFGCMAGWGAFVMPGTTMLPVAGPAGTIISMIRALKDRQLAEIPILAMTANAFEGNIKASAEAGMQSHIAKPADSANLKKEIRAVLGRRKS